MLSRATGDGRVMVESSDKTRSPGGGNDGLPQYSCRKKPKKRMKRQKDTTREDDQPKGRRLSSTLLEKSGGQPPIASERMKKLGQSGNEAQLCMCLVVKVQSSAVKNNIA